MNLLSFSRHIKINFELQATKSFLSSLSSNGSGVIKMTSVLYILSLMTQKPEPPANTFSRPKRKPRLKPGKSINVSAEEKARYEALINSQDANYEGIIIADRRKV